MKGCWNLLNAFSVSVETIMWFFFFNFFFFNFLGLFIYLFMAVLGLRFCARAFSSCGKWGPLFIAMRGPLLLQSTGSRRADSVVVAHGPSWSVACGIFPDRGSNPCPLHWQADSQPLHHQGSPCVPVLLVVWHGASSTGACWLLGGTGS